MRVYNLNMHLFDEAIKREVHSISKFISIEKGIEAKVRFDVLRAKIIKGTACGDELLTLAELIKRHCD